MRGTDNAARPQKARMVRFIVLWEAPSDPETFDRHYREIHIPLGRRLPGLRSYTISPTTAVRGEPYYLVAELEWETMDELRAAFGSPEGQAVADDVAKLQRLASVRGVIIGTGDDVL